MILVLFIVFSLITPSTAWFASRPVTTSHQYTSQLHRRDTPPFSEGNDVHEEVVGTGAEFSTSCGEIEMRFSDWQKGFVFDEVVLRANFTYSDDEKEDKQELRKQHLLHIQDVLENYLLALPFKRESPSIQFMPAFIAGGLVTATLAGLGGFLTSFGYDREYWKEAVQENRDRINALTAEGERYRKFVYLGSLVEKLEDGFSNSMKEIFLNGRFSEGALASIKDTIRALFGDNWKRSLLRKYYPMAASVVAAMPVARTDNSLIIEVCYPTALEEKTLFQITAIGVFEGNNYVFPILPEFAIVSGNNSVDVTEVRALSDCKSMGPLRLCHPLNDKTQRTYCSLNREHRRAGCPHVIEDTSSTQYTHVTPTVRGYVVATKAKELLLFGDSRDMAQRTPLTSSVIFITVPIGTTLKVGTEMLRPRYAVAEISFTLEYLPALPPKATPELPVVIFHRMESVFADCVFVIIVLVLIFFLFYLAYRSRTYWKNTRASLARHQGEIGIALKRVETA